MLRSSAQPAARVVTRGSEADTVITRVGGREGEFPGGGAAGVDDAVVVVEGLIDGDGDGEIGVGFVDGSLGGVLKGGIMACGTISILLGF